MLKAFLPTLKLLLLASPLAWADSPSCPEDKPRNGIDYSLPCFLHSPIEEADAKIFFPSGTALLTLQAKATLDRQTTILLAYPELLAITEGFVDSKESRALQTPSNLALKRARAAREYLIQKGIAEERIESVASPTPALIPRQEDEKTLATMRFVRTRTQER
ncbi:MAG: OmpA family protein [Alphaproteobacteria bacterium]|nr:OmpA family protein [Alphaproteobacteria bacterium]